MRNLNYSYLKRLVLESIERELNFTHILRSFCYEEFSYDYGVASRILGCSLRRSSKGFMRKCALRFSNRSKVLDLRNEYLVEFIVSVTLADKSFLNFHGEINWDFRFNRTLRSVSFHRVLASSYSHCEAVSLRPDGSTLSL